jgi:CheY-like chemotaxis protein
VQTATEQHLVLVVDDDRFIRDVVAACLEDEPDIRTAAAADGQEALRLLAAERPSVMILDLAMPRLDGFEVCRRLKADPSTSRIPVIAMSAGERRRPALDAGCDEFVAKPFDVDYLCRTVRRWLDTPGR